MSLQVFPNVQVKLCDFGLVHLKTHAEITMEGDRAVGTPAYTAPEVLVGVPMGNKILPQLCSDVWAMSCSAVEWFSGRFLWKLGGKQDLKKYVKARLKTNSPPDELRSVVESVRKILKLGLDYEWKKRPSAERMKQLMGLLVSFPCVVCIFYNIDGYFETNYVQRANCAYSMHTRLKVL